MSATCSGCPRRWNSTTQAHCVRCHEQFATVGVSEAHDKTGPCLPPAEVTRKNGDPVYRAVDTAEGVVWRSFAQAPTDAWAKR